MKRNHLASALRFWSLLLIAGCTHSDSFSSLTTPALSPFGSGTDVQLTLNPEQDYWPAWTEDGRGILYSYVDAESATIPLHRCLGLLPAEGGSRLWQLCDNRATRGDTLSSYSAYALDSTGRLLLAEVTAPANSARSDSPQTTLWLTDSAAPFVRTSLLTLPVTLGNTAVTWLTDLAWTGANTFIGLGQQFNSVMHCVRYPPNDPFAPVHCFTRDSIFADSGGVVFRGSIAGGHATLQAISGTEGATSYSLAQNNRTIVFTIKHQLMLFRVAAGGGAPVPTPPGGSGDVNLTQELVGVSCKASTCIVAKDGIFLTQTIETTFIYAHYFFNGIGLVPGTMELHRMSLDDGTDEIVQSNMTNSVYATPQLSPVSGDLVLQVGGGWGHLQTFATRGTGNLFLTDGNSDLHLYKGLVP